MALSATAVVTVDRVQDEPAIGSGVSETDLEPLIEAASIQIDEYLDKPVVQRTRVESRLLGRRDRNRWRGEHRAYLDQRPVVSITSILDDATTANELKIDDDFYLNKQRGTLESRHNNGFIEPIGFWNITYVVGLYATTEAVDWRVRRAAIKLVVASRARPNPDVTRERIGSLELQYGSSGGSRSEGSVAELPPDVRALLDTIATVAV